MSPRWASPPCSSSASSRSSARSTSRAPRSCSSSRTPTSPSRSQPAATSSKRARSSTPPQQPSCARTRRSAKPTSARSNFLHRPSVLFLPERVHYVHAPYRTEQPGKPLLLRSLVRVEPLRVRLVRRRTHGVETPGGHAGNCGRVEGKVQDPVLAKGGDVHSVAKRTVTHDPRPSDGSAGGLPANLPHQPQLCKPPGRGGLRLVLPPRRGPFRPTIPRGLPLGAASGGGPETPERARRQSLQRRHRGGRPSALLQGRDERAPRVPVVLPLGEQGAGGDGLRRRLPPDGGAANGPDVRVVHPGALRVGEKRGGGPGLPAARRYARPRERKRAGLRAARGRWWSGFPVFVGWLRGIINGNACLPHRWLLPALPGVLRAAAEHIDD